MLNYYTRTIEPIMSAIADEMTRKFLTKNARTRGQSITYYRNQFSLVPLAKLSTTLGELIANRIVTSNEARQIIGMSPSDDISADSLLNPHVDPVTNAASVDGGAGVENFRLTGDEKIQNV